MTAITLTPAQRKAQRAKAHSLNPVVMIGNDGLTDAVCKEIDRALKSHGLIKVRVLGDDREARTEMLDTICDRLGAAPVQHIGKLLVVWRPLETKLEKAIPSKKVARAYQTARLAKKTTPAKPKRRKVRQASPKKIALG